MRWAYLARIAIFFFLSCFSPALALAAEQVVSLSGDLGGALDAFRGNRAEALTSRSRRFSRSSLLRLSMTAADGKSFELTLGERLGRYWPAYFVSSFGITSDNADVLLFRGSAWDGISNVPLAGAIYEHHGVPTLFLDFLSDDGSVMQHVTVPLGAEMSAVPILESRPLSELSHRSCANDGPLAPAEIAPSYEARSSESVAPLTGNAGTLSLRQLDIATEADFEYFSAYGTESNARIAAVINAADTIYQRDLSIDIRIASQHVVTTSSQPYSSTDSGTLLDQFRSYTNTNAQLGAADDFHLFTGKDIDSNVIGIAYLSVVCAAPTYSYGVTQDFGSLTYLVFAHEIGHNLGASHDSVNGNIMAPAIDSGHTSFSTTSRTAIGTFVNSYGSCMTSTDTPDDGGGGGGGSNPQPREASVSLFASFDPSTNRFYAQISASDASAADCRAYLMGSSDITMAGAQSFAWGRSGKTTISGGAKNKKRIAGTDTPLYFQAVYSCPSIGVSVASSVQSISPANATKPKQIVDSAKWLKSTLKAAAKDARKKRNNI